MKEGFLCVLLLVLVNPYEAATICTMNSAHQPKIQMLIEQVAFLVSCQEFEKAMQIIRNAVSCDLQSVDLFNLAGICAVSLGDKTQAELYWRQAIAMESQAAEAHANLGVLLAGQERDTEAEQHYQHAIALEPANASTHFNLGIFCAKRGRQREAEHCYRQAIALNPEAATAHSNLGVLLADCKRRAEAEICFRHAIALDTRYPLARHNLAMLLLYQGHLPEGWAYHEARYDPAMPEIDTPLPNLPGAQWQGEPLAGKSLLVWPEQGLGDMIQFCRYLPLLKEQGATRITLVCKPELKSLMTTLSGVDAVFALNDTAALQEHDFWTLPMSLPLHFKTELATIPARLPYLHTVPGRIARWSQRLSSLPSSGLRVGLVWKGNAMHANDSHRSLPGISTLAPLWSVPGVQFISLQTGLNVTAASDQTLSLLHFGDDIADFADTAAIVQQLDLLISVDTAAHLAGALGKPCWVLLPAR